MKKIVLLITAALLLSSCSIRAHAPEADGEQTGAKEIENPTPEPITAGMSIEEKIGQLFLVRCDNENIQSIMDILKI